MLRKLVKLIITILFLILIPYTITCIINGKTIRINSEASSIDQRLREYGVQLLASEVSSDYSEEMLKTQAILVRTTLYKQIEEKGSDLLKETHIQEEMDLLWRQKLEKAWDDTEGQVVMYENKLALVPFHQVSNGKTRSGVEVLGSEDYPYLQIKECPKDVEAENQITNQFIQMTGILIESWDSAGYVTSVTINEETINGEAFRDTYNLASSCFEVQAFEGQTRILTKGVGHGLGLSQYSANEMAKEGKSYDEILQFFFPGTEIKEVAEILWNIE